MDSAPTVSPWILYAACVLGAAGVFLALPRTSGRTMPLLGWLIAAAAGGGFVLYLTARAGVSAAPNVYFYIFSALALGSALRVITHRRPVYAALYFIITVLAVAGLFLILSAEFLAFALIIVYAGAILITYLFVIMLASQPSGEDRENELARYDTVSHEPGAAVIIGFVLLAALTTLLFRGTPRLHPPEAPAGGSVLAQMPRKVEQALRRSGELKAGWALETDASGGAKIDPEKRLVRVKDESGQGRWVEMPAGLQETNVEQVGFNLLRDHPGAIELAGVILLMAMLGAVVLSRKQVDLAEEAKARHAKHLREANAPGEAAEVSA